MITATELVVAFDDRPLFPPLSFRLEKGQCMHLKGANGSGKTSLLKAIAGLLPLASGKCQRDSSSELGFIGHKLALLTELQVRDNLAFWAERALKSRAIDEVLREVALSNYDDSYVWELSEGQRKRLALARFFLLANDLWLLDEPFNALDKDYRYTFEQALSAYLKQGGMLIITSHLPFTLDGVPIIECDLS